MTEENEILRKLVVEEEDVIKELEKLVEEASKYFLIEKPSGKIIFKDFGTLTNKQRIAIVLLGKYFAKKLKLIENDSLGISEIAKELGSPRTSLSGPIKELVKEGYVEYLPGRKYRIAYHRIKELFDKILVTQNRG